MASPKEGPTAAGRSIAALDAHTCAVQFYSDEAFLFETVARFLATGIENDEHLLVLATERHRDGCLAALAKLAGDAFAARAKLTFLDAHATLAHIMDGDLPDAQAFHDLLCGELASFLAMGEPVRIRVYGELVDLLWQQGCTAGAIRLEELCNEAASEYGFSLMCAYSMARVHAEESATHSSELCDRHGNVLPTETYAELASTHAQLREIAQLRERARALEAEIAVAKDAERVLIESFTAILAKRLG